MMDLFNQDVTKSMKSAFTGSGDFSAIADPTIPRVGELTGVELRMLPPLLKNNMTKPFWPFPGFANVYCLNIVIADVKNQLAGPPIDLKGFPRLGDMEPIPINTTMFYWKPSDIFQNPPSQIHILSSVIKSKGGLRQAGEIMQEVQTDQEYGEVLDILANAANAPLWGIDLAKRLAGIVGRYLAEVEDKPIGTIIRSYTDLRGDLDNLGITPVKVRTANVDFNYELILRDSNREQLIADKIGVNANDLAIADPDI